jgi:hypothetical protein
MIYNFFMHMLMLTFIFGAPSAQASNIEGRYTLLPNADEPHYYKRPVKRVENLCENSLLDKNLVNTHNRNPPSDQTLVEFHSPLDASLEKLMYHCKEKKRGYNMEAAKKLLLPLANDHKKFIKTIKFAYQVPQDTAEIIYKGFKQERPRKMFKGKNQ